MSSSSSAVAERSQLTSELSQATDLTVSLDGVFFDDGTFVGPNSTGFFERINAIVSAKLDLLSDVARANEQGDTDLVLDGIIAKSSEPDTGATAGSSPEQYYKEYTKLFATEIRNMKQAYGKEKLVAYLVELHKRPHPVLKKE